MQDAELGTLLSPFADIISELETTGDPLLAAFAARARTIRALGSVPELKDSIWGSPKMAVWHQTAQLWQDMRECRIKGTARVVERLKRLVEELRPPQIEGTQDSARKVEAENMGAARAETKLPPPQPDHPSTRIEDLHSQLAALAKAFEEQKRTAAGNLNTAGWLALLALVMLGWLVYKHS